LRERARRNTHDEHAILDEFDATVLGEYRIHNGRPELARFINEAKVDSPKSSRESVQEFAQRGRLFLSPVHDNTRVRSMTAAGDSAPGSGDAVVTRV